MREVDISFQESNSITIHLKPSESVALKQLTKADLEAYDVFVLGADFVLRNPSTGEVVSFPNMGLYIFSEEDAPKIFLDDGYLVTGKYILSRLGEVKNISDSEFLSFTSMLETESEMNAQLAEESKEAQEKLEAAVKRQEIADKKFNKAESLNDIANKKVEAAKKLIEDAKETYNKTQEVTEVIDQKMQDLQEKEQDSGDMDTAELLELKSRLRKEQDKLEELEEEQIYNYEFDTDYVTDFIEPPVVQQPVVPSNPTASEVVDPPKTTTFSLDLVNLARTTEVDGDGNIITVKGGGGSDESTFNSSVVAQGTAEGINTSFVTGEHTIFGDNRDFFTGTGSDELFTPEQMARTARLSFEASDGFKPTEITFTVPGGGSLPSGFQMYDIQTGLFVPSNGSSFTLSNPDFSNSFYDLVFVYDIQTLPNQTFTFDTNVQFEFDPASGFPTPPVSTDELSETYQFLIRDIVDPTTDYGDDTFLILANNPNANAITTGDGNATVYGNQADDSITGGAGQDLIYGYKGNDGLDGGGGDDSIFGESGDDVIKGGDGNDTISGGIGDDEIFAGAGNDSITDEQGDDLINGNSGDDYVLAGSGADTIDGGNGIDTADYSAKGAVVANLSNTDSITGFVDLTYNNGAASNSISNVENLYTGAGNDSVGGDAANNTFITGAGNDTILASSGDDSIDGGADIDNLSYAYLDDVAVNTTETGITLDLTTGEVSHAASSSQDTIVNIENIELTEYNDYLVVDPNNLLTQIDGRDNTGISTSFDSSGLIPTAIVGGDTVDFTNLASTDTYNIDLNNGLSNVNGTAINLDNFEQVIAGNASGTINASLSTISNQFTTGSGNDSINAGNGSNLIDAGDGNNTVVTFAGNDNITAGTGNDTIDAGSGVNLVNAGDGQNNITAGNGFDTINSGSGDDIIDAGSGVNVIDAGDGNNNVLAQGGNDIIDTGTGNDTVNAGAGNNDIEVRAGNNLVNATSGDDTIVAEDGDDTINAGDGENIIKAGNGINIVTSGVGNDDIESGTGDDTIDAGNGDNLVNIAAGNNSVTSGTGNDTLNSGVGDDTIDAGNGDNEILAGDGANNIQAGTGDDLVRTGTGDDTIDAGSGVNDINAGEGDNDITTAAGDDSIVSGDGDDSVSAGAGNNNINAGSGNNLITSLVGNDTITTADANDTIDAGAGDNLITAGEGNNVVVSASGNDTVTAGSGDDVVLAGDGQNNINVSGGNNNVVTGFDNDTIIATSGDDTIDAGDGDNLVIAGDGNNVITVGAGMDTVQSGTGDDSINLGAGNDSINAVSGNDTIDGGLGDADSINFADITASGVNIDMVTGTVSGAVNGGLTGFENIILTDQDDTIALDSIDPNYVIDGANGNDLLDLSATSPTVGKNIDLTTGIVTEGAVTATVSNFENVISSDSDDTIVGTFGNNSISSGGGADSIDGGMLNDTIDAGDGNDTILMSDSDGNDSIQGGTGTDLLDYSNVTSFGVNVNLDTQIATGGAGVDNVIDIEDVIATTGDDSVVGSSVDNVITTSDGEDTLTGGLGDDTLDGGNDIDIADYAYATTTAINANLATGIVTAGVGDTDQLIDIEGLVLALGDDTATGSSNGDYIDVSDGNDIVNAGAGNDTVLDGAGNDVINGDAGDDILVMNNDGDVDVVNGGSGNDTISYENFNTDVSIDIGAGTATSGGVTDNFTGISNANGGFGNDNFVGDVNSNSLVGNAGNDFFTSSDGNDTLDGGADTDTADYSSNPGAIQANLTGTNGTVDKNVGVDEISSIDLIVATSLNDTITFSNTSFTSIQADAGYDVVAITGGVLGGIEGNTLAGFFSDIEELDLTGITDLATSKLEISFSDIQGMTDGNNTLTIDVNNLSDLEISTDPTIFFTPVGGNTYEFQNTGGGTLATINIV